MLPLVLTHSETLSASSCVTSGHYCSIFELKPWLFWLQRSHIGLKRCFLIFYTPIYLHTFEPAHTTKNTPESACISVCPSLPPCGNPLFLMWGTCFLKCVQRMHWWGFSVTTACFPLRFVQNSLPVVVFLPKLLMSCTFYSSRTWCSANFSANKYAWSF